MWAGGSNSQLRQALPRSTLTLVISNPAWKLRTVNALAGAGGIDALRGIDSFEPQRFSSEMPHFGFKKHLSESIQTGLVETVEALRAVRGADPRGAPRRVAEIGASRQACTIRLCHCLHYAIRPTQQEAHQLCNIISPAPCTWG